jgi:hypothetical protein
MGAGFLGRVPTAALSLGFAIVDCRDQVSYSVVFCS